MALNSYTSFLFARLPNLMRLASFAASELRDFDRRYQRHLDKTRGQQEVLTTFFDLADIYPEEISAAVCFYIEQIAAHVELSLLPSRRSRLNGMIRRLLSTDDETNGYLTGLGELVVLDELLKMPFATVASVEPPLQNGKTADFEVQMNGSKHYIEVATIRFDADRIETDEDLVAFFRKRAEQKIVIKTEDLPAGLSMLIFLVTYGADNIEKLLSFKAGLSVLCDELESIHAFGPFVVGSFRDGDSPWRFGAHPVIQLLKRDEDKDKPE